MDASAPPSFLCPISQELMRDPVTLADGHSYDRENIETWLSSHSTSPVTGAVLDNNHLTTTHALRNSIEEWLVANFKLVPRSAVTYDEATLATGNFKTVHCGTLSGHPQPVAVLRMRMGGACEEEAAKLVKLGRHSALVRYLGICTEGLEQLLITELAPHGSLDSFLEQHEGEVTLQHKLIMLQQVCGGMATLSDSGLIHRDLAIRNVLVFAFDEANPATTRVKITDFGLAMDRLYQTHAYGAQNEDVPFRWMPPEALKKRRFSEKSDVWAFGVTAWELLTDGEVPFAFISSNEAVAERVCGGERLPRPDGCSTEAEGEGVGGASPYGTPDTSGHDMKSGCSKKLANDVRLAGSIWRRPSQMVRSSSEYISGNLSLYGLLSLSLSFRMLSARKGGCFVMIW